MRVRSLLAVCASFALFAGLALVAVTLSQGPSKPTVPVQQSGTAADRPHRVPAGADLGRVVDGRVVSAASGARTLPGPVAEDLDSTREVPGAVGPAVKPKPLKFPVQGKTSETRGAARAPAMRKLQGYNPKTSERLPLTSGDQVTYANADGTKTSFTYTTPVNYRSPGGKWTPVSTSLVPVVSPSASGSPSVSASPSGSPSASVGASASGWTEKSEADPET